MLVESGRVNINESNREGDTPLCVAACTGKLDVVQYLCRVGADVTRVNHDGAGACWIACWNGHLPVVQFLSGLSEVDLTQVRCRDGHAFVRHPVRVSVCLLRAQWC